MVILWKILNGMLQVGSVWLVCVNGVWIIFASQECSFPDDSWAFQGCLSTALLIVSIMIRKWMGTGSEALNQGREDLAAAMQVFPHAICVFCFWSLFWMLQGAVLAGSPMPCSLVLHLNLASCDLLFWLSLKLQILDLVYLLCRFRKHTRKEYP